MRRPERRIVEAGGRPQQDDLVLVQDDVVADLLEAAMDEEVRDRVDDRQETQVAQARRHPDQILLGNAHVEEALGKGLLDRLDQVDAHVAGQEEQALVRLHAGEKRIEDLASHDTPPFSAATA